MSLTVRTDRPCIHAQTRSTRYLLVEIEAPAATPRDTGRLPVNLAFVLDRSGSMSGAKMSTARAAVEDAINRLSPTDRFAVVTYDDQVEVVAEVMTATADARRRAIDAVRRVDARGSTNLGEGWLRGGEQISRTDGQPGVTRTLLLTDGLANVGTTDPVELQQHAAELYRRGVSTTTFGVGADFDERLLQGMADAGGGHFYFIESAAQISDYMTSEVGESLEVVARDARIRIVAPEGVRVESLSAFGTAVGRGTGDTHETIVSVGDLVSEQHLSVVLRVDLPSGRIGDEVVVSIGVDDRDGVLGSASATTRVRFEYADDRANDLQPPDRDVDTAVARTYAARVRIEALELNRQGRFADASQHLEAVARRIQAYAGSDRDLLEIVAALEAERPVMSAPMAPMASKAAYFASVNEVRSRSPQGRAKR